MKRFAVIFLLCLCGGLFADTVWEETFSKGITMEANGYQVEGKNPTDQIILNKNEIVYHCSKGSAVRYKKKVPFLKKGEFSFEINVNEKNASYYNHLSAMIGYCGVLFYGNGGAKALMRYDAKKRNDIVLFSTKNNSWMKVAIKFDTEKKVAKYYVNDMYNPVFIDNTFEFAPGAEKNPSITIGNYGSAKDTIVNRIRNIKLNSAKEVENPDSTLVWEEKFPGATMEENGFRVTVKNSKDRFEIENGTLKIHSYNAPYNGLRYAKEIPFLRRGELSFDLNVNMERNTGYNYLSLMIGFYSLLICPNGGPHTFQVYNPKKGNNHNVAPLKDGTWYKVAIRFDLDKKVNEYYVNDMENPVFVDDDAPYDVKKGVPSTLMIGNYGLAAGKVINGIRNIQLRTIKAETESAGKAENLSGTVILNGFSSPGYNLSAFGEKPQKTFHLLSINHNERPVNRLQFEQLPGFNVSKPPKLLVLCDIANGTGLPKHVERQIETVVKRGTTLLYLGGLFNLNKGDIPGSLMEKILPVTCGKPFDMAFFDTPAEISGIPDAKVSALHIVKAKPDAEVKETVNGYPFVVTGKYGHGKVIVVTGTSNVERGNFGNSAQWIESIKTIINQ